MSKRYTAEFKRDAIALVRSSPHRNVTEIARELGVSPEGLRGWAQSITTRWYDHQQHAAPRWRRRATVLERANPELAPTRSSWALLARDIVTYPETVTLAHALHQHRVLAVPGGHTSTRPRTHTAFLRHTATRLGLPRLDPSHDDPLHAWIHHRTP
ncbi:transposase (plasmid) [Kitasatospora sp. NBC_00070]|uniref:transposase n=1 Tax=Kitasatospora sp. NBC_00070 TaxID=2975962 RepID=UPI002F9192C7